MYVGSACEYAMPESIDDLRATCGSRNKLLVASLKEDTHSVELHKLTQGLAFLVCIWRLVVLPVLGPGDYAKGRMTEPLLVENLDLDTVNLAKRFAVVNGLTRDGSPKLRAVDSETAAGTNPCTQPAEKLSNDSLDKLVACIMLFYALTGALPSLWKADIDSAFRRVPIVPSQRWVAWVTYMVNGEKWAAGHLVEEGGWVGGWEEG